MGRAKPLKDKEFNLGGAYSFGAKIGIIGPAHPVIISSEKIGGDAKEHFERAKLAGSKGMRDRKVQHPIRYIEGLSRACTRHPNVRGR
jgi:hypothetical protein